MIFLYITAFVTWVIIIFFIMYHSLCRIEVNFKMYKRPHKYFWFELFVWEKPIRWKNYYYNYKNKCKYCINFKIPISKNVDD